MRFVGIDVAAERHVVAVVDEADRVLIKATPFTLRYDGRHKVGDELAAVLIAAAAGSVGRHHGEAYRIQVRYTCEDLDVLRRRVRDLERDIDRLLEHHEIGRLLTTIDGIGPQTAARLVATFGDFSSFPSARAVASYVGVVPALQQSGKRTLPAREPHAHWRGPLAGQALDARAHRHRQHQRRQLPAARKEEAGLLGPSPSRPATSRRWEPRRNAADTNVGELGISYFGVFRTTEFGLDTSRAVGAHRALARA